MSYVLTLQRALRAYVLTYQRVLPAYNLEKKAGNKFTKLSKIGFSMERFTANFLQFSSQKSQNLALHARLSLGHHYSPSDASISGIFLKFPNFL